MTTTCCPHCRTEVRVDLSRIPAGRTARLTCPSCQQQYPVTAGPAAPAPGATPAAPAPAAISAATAAASTTPPAGGSGATPADRAWLRRELEALRVEMEHNIAGTVLAALGVKDLRRDESETADPARRHALVCEPDAAFARIACEALTELGYQPEVVTDLRTAWHALDREWGVVMLTEALTDDAEAGAKLQDRLSRLPGNKRRRMFVVHVSNEVRSLDGGMAFVLNANLTLHRSDAAQAREILKKGMTDHEKLYRPFFDAQDSLHA